MLRYGHEPRRFGVFCWVSAGLLVLIALLAACSPSSTPNLPSFHGEQDTAVLTQGETLALHLQQGKTGSDWLVTYDGTKVHVDETGALLGNDHYSGNATGSSETNQTNIQISGWTAASTSFYAWADPDQSGAVVVKWPYGWDKELSLNIATGNR